MAGYPIDYLPDANPDYVGILAVDPQGVFVTAGNFRQRVIEYDDESLQVVTMSDAPKLFFRLSWEAVPKADAETIFDFYFDTAKAKGQARSFLFQPPDETEVYVVHFASDLSRNMPDPFRRGFSEIMLRIVGYYADSSSGGS